MAREKSPLVRVERTTDSGTKYFEKVRQPAKNKAAEPDTGSGEASLVTSESAGRRARTK